MTSQRSKSLFLLAALFLSNAAHCLAANNPIQITFMGVSVQERLERLLIFLLDTAASLVLLFLIGSGIFFAVSAGNPEAQQKAKKMLITSLEGLFVILFSYALLFLLDRLLVQE